MSTATKRVNIMDLKPEVDMLMPQLAAKFEEVVRSGQFILGPETRSFEAESAAYLGVKHAVGLNSGTDALVIALRALNIGAGDEVVTTPFSFFATAETISLVGAKPVFVDVDLDSMNLDPDLIEAAVTPRTKAIMPVHLFGRPAAMGKIHALAEKHGLKVIEDAAQSFGAVYTPLAGDVDSPWAGKQTGGLGDVGCFSFYPTKNLGAYGDAGLLTTNDDEVAETARRLRNHGSSRRYHNEVLGYNSRLDSLQAMVLRLKLPLLDGYNTARRRVATRYNELLAGTPGLITPGVVDGHVFHQYTVRIIHKDRDLVIQDLDQRGVGSMIYYPIPQDRLEVYEGQYPRFEKNEELSRQVLSLPIYPHLSDDDLAHVAQAVRETLS